MKSDVFQLEYLHGFSHQWGTNYSYRWDSTKFQQGTPYNLRGVNEYEIEDNEVCLTLAIGTIP